MIKAGVGFVLAMLLLPFIRAYQMREAGGLWRSVDVNVPSDQTLNGIVFAGDRAGWIWAGRNTIVATTNSGTTWWTLPTNLSGPETHIAALWFMDERRGWASGSLSQHPAIWTTEDGGRTWSLQQERPRSYPDSLGAILDIQFVDELRGWAVGFNGLNALILATKDGGRRWNVQYTGHEITGQFRQIRFTDDKHGWALSYDAVMQTDDGGDTWKLRYFDSGTLNCIEPISQADVWLAGAWGYVLHTRNGLKWSEIPISGRRGTSYWGCVKFTPNGLGLAWGPNCNLAVTRDFGTSWTEEACPVGTRLRSEITLEGMAITPSAIFMIANPNYLLVRAIKK